MPSGRALRLADPSEVDPDDAPRMTEVLTREHMRRLSRTENATEMPPFGYAPHSRQAVLHATRSRWGKRFRSACWGRRCGKTQAGAAEVAAEAPQLVYDQLTGRGLWEGDPQPVWSPGIGPEPDPFLRVGVVAPTYVHIRECKIALLRYFRRVEEGGWLTHTPRSDSASWWALGGIRLDFMSGQIPERLVGGKYHILWLEEAARLKEAVWRDNIAPTLADTRGGLITTSTPLGKNWYYRDIWARANVEAARDVADELGGRWQDVIDPAFVSVYATTLHNTAVPGLADEVMAMKARMPLDMWKRNFLASFDSFRGQCFTLIEQIHRLRDVPAPHAMQEIWAAMDCGQTHRACAGVGGLHRSSSRYLIVDAVARSNTDGDGDDAWARREDGDTTVWTTIMWSLLTGWVGHDRWRSVPVFLPHDAVELKRRFRARGFTVREAFQDPANSLDWFKIGLHNGAIQVRPRVVWNSMQTLRHPDEGRWSNKPWVEEDDDPFDMGRYLFSVPIRRGDRGDACGLPGAGMGWGLR